ncbi:hypothetical protein SNE40_001867 [Patella caerulea]|uniref:RING-type E3 ubiquitin transferase n=1 Tax=Patella caerulea TaxID=87958 RepID=A0AAN8K633_PATCE
MVELNFADKLTTAGVGLSSILLYVFYNKYKNRLISSDQVKASVSLGENIKEQLELAPDHKIPYATVEGIVTAVGQTLSSRHDTVTEGVIQHSVLKEHKSRRVNGFWSDATRTIRNVIDTVPFYLRPASRHGHDVIVTEVGEAEFLMDELAVTYDKFEPSQSSFLQTGLDRIFGEVTKGLHEREEMLVVGTGILGVGEVFLENGKVKIGPGAGTKYILTKLTKKEVIKKLKSQSSVFKYLMIFTGLIGGGCLIYLLVKFSRKYFEERRNREMFESARLGRVNNESGGQTENECVICLTNPKEVVILNCGHVALCAQCAEILPNPTCPVCRGHITRFVPLYQS